MNNEQSAAATPSAGTIDTPEFRRLLNECEWEEHATRVDGVRGTANDWSKQEALEAALITHIDSRHSAGVAAARMEADKLRDDLAWHKESLNRHAAKLRSVWQGIADVVEKATGNPCGPEPFDDLEATLAAAREQALEEAASVCGRIAARNIGEEGTGAAMDCIAGIRALASQPATTAQTDEVTDSVDRDAPLRGAPAATDGVGAVVLDEPERMSTDESREYLVKFMDRHFTDKTFHRYIRADRSPECMTALAGDFAWQMARALRMLADAASTDGGSRFRAEGGNTNQPETAAAAAPVAQAPVVQEDIAALREQSEAWHAVFQALCESTPDWYREGGRTIDCAVATIKRFAAPTQVAPVLADALTEFLTREMPAGTVIGDPAWWAPRIARAIEAATPPALPVARLAEKAVPWNELTVYTRDSNKTVAMEYEIAEWRRIAERQPQPAADVERDAARYRWLRDPNRGMSNLRTVISDDYQPPYFELKCGAELDSAIDAAKAKGGGK